MGECLFLAACHYYVLSVYLLLHVFVWQNKILLLLLLLLLIRFKCHIESCH